jgi:hypothetical protein
MYMLHTIYRYKLGYIRPTKSLYLLFSLGQPHLSITPTKKASYTFVVIVVNQRSMLPRWLPNLELEAAADKTKLLVYCLLPSH